MRLSDFDYNLPSELIAQHPSERREESRLMVVFRRDQRIEHARFRDLPEFLAAEDLLVINNTRVFPARLFAKREGRTGLIEVLLLREVGERVWEALVKPGRKARPGTRLVFDRSFHAVVLESEEVDAMTRRLRLECEGDVWQRIQALGQMPLPPYISRKPGEESAEDRDRYQTVFARVTGSVAAPTAGLHFTEPLLARLCHVEITLHVGYGTFQPIKTDEIDRHRMHSEYYELSAAAAEPIQRQIEEGRRVVAVGTTSTRVLEHVRRRRGRIEPESGWTDIFIYPGFEFRVVGALITNFHLPKSTLLLLVSAFAGTGFIRRCYSEAVREEYRFFSYGDAMLIL